MSSSKSPHLRHKSGVENKSLQKKLLTQGKPLLKVHHSDGQHETTSKKGLGLLAAVLELPLKGVV